MSVLRSARPCDELGQLVQTVGELVVTRGEGAQHGVQVGDDLADELVAAGQRRCQRRCLGQHRRDGAALALEHLQQFAGQRVHLVGIQRPEQRPEAADKSVDVERRRRSAPAGSSVPVAVCAPSPGPSSRAR